MNGRIVRTQDPRNLAWLDLEMTGLEPTRDVILQAALIITNHRLEVLEEFSADVWQPEAALERMSPFVRNMHEKNGLIDRVRASTLDQHAVERLLLERVAGWCTYPATLCGNTIGMDKRFVETWLPGLHGYLHYRVLDVSSIKILAKLWYGESAAFEKPKAGEHDAIVDIRNSIAELRHYRDSLFRSGQLP